MKRRYAIPVVLLTATVAAFIALFIRSFMFARNVERIRAGDGKDTVLALLGEPTKVFIPASPGDWLGVSVETWAYGKVWPWTPWTHRLFRPEPGDVAIEFDSTGNVTQVVVPAE
jgi:hypothetical protein